MMQFGNVYLLGSSAVRGGGGATEIDMSQFAPTTNKSILILELKKSDDNVINALCSLDKLGCWDIKVS